MISRKVGLAQKLPSSMSDREINVPRRGKGGRKSNSNVDGIYSSLTACLLRVLGEQALD